MQNEYFSTNWRFLVMIFFKQFEYNHNQQTTFHLSGYLLNKKMVQNVYVDVCY